MTCYPSLLSSLDPEPYSLRCHMENNITCHIVFGFDVGLHLGTLKSINSSIHLYWELLCSEYWGRCSQFSSVQSLSLVWLFEMLWTAALQASLSITNSQSLLELMSIESVMLSNHFILCHPLLLLPSIFHSMRVFSNVSVLHIRCSEYWSFSFSTSPSNEYSGLISFRIDCSREDK